MKRNMAHTNDLWRQAAFAPAIARAIPVASVAQLWKLLAKRRGSNVNGVLRHLAVAFVAIHLAAVPIVRAAVADHGCQYVNVTNEAVNV